MNLLLPAFKVVSLVFAVSAIITGAQAILDPLAFSRSFGLPVTSVNDNPAESYISLMGIRQFATGVILLIFAYQAKWVEVATFLGVIGVIVAGTDGYYLSRNGTRSLAMFHAIPGALIASLAWLAVFTMS